jgi:nucleoid-associated protein YgaU
MNKFSIHRKTGVVAALVGVAVCMTGCDCAKKLEASEQQNQMLTQQVAELEAQLEQAAAPAATEPGRPVYLVVEGDSLWSIAEKQLGSGARYKEILALNPGITRDQPLPIGTELILPAK